LAPTLGATLLFYSLIWEHLGEGPQWNDVVVANANLCKKNWWQNMFFIQNWFPVEKMVSLSGGRFKVIEIRFLFFLISVCNTYVSTVYRDANVRSAAIADLVVVQTS
jgi:hypothetical protein